MAEIKGNNMPKIKRQNEEAIRSTIYKYGPISRSQIADMLSLTPPTITTNVASLIEEGLVAEVGGEEESGHAVGRRPINIDFIPSARYVVGCELGPYNTYVCAMDIGGRVLAQAKYPLSKASYPEMLDELSHQINGVIAESKIARTKLMGVGVCLPGFVDSSRGYLRNHRAGWNERPICEDLASKLNLPVRVENNVRCRAISESLNREKPRPDTFIYYFVSKGIACALMDKNSILFGPGEAGHMVIQKSGKKCPTCGNSGCLEAYSSEYALEEKCKELIAQGKASMLYAICKNKKSPTIQEVLAAQMHGDADVCNAINESVTYLGVGLANIINLINPQKVLVDGRMLQTPQNREIMQDAVRKNLFGLNEKEVDLEYLPFDPFGGARGAAAMAIKKFLIQNT